MSDTSSSVHVMTHDTHTHEHYSRVFSHDAANDMNRRVLVRMCL